MNCRTRPAAAKEAFFLEVKRQSDKTLTWCLTIGLFMGVALSSKAASSTVLGPVISTEAGSFQGLKLTPPGQTHAVYAFLGIPYAEPPTGLKRFKKPKPAGFIPGIFKATHKPPSCFQLEADLYFPWADSNSTMSEDCLYLNIWAPVRREDKEGLKPVMVWIHGGGSTVGSSAMDLYDGQTISALGEVIVVTLNYRLGVFGFLSSWTKDAPGNVALYDQLLVLHWVQTNIQYFGGDPKRVTLFGESFGASCSSLLALSPLSRGLFRRMIVQSGSSYSPLVQSLSQNAEAGNRLAGLFGCANGTFTLSSHPNEIVNCLRSVPAAELTKTYYEQHGSIWKKINLALKPQFGDKLISESPSAIFCSKNYTPLDVFVGVNHDEGSVLFSFFFPEVYQKYTEGKLVMSKALAVELLDGYLKQIHFQQPEKASNYYFKDIGDDQKTIVKAICEALGDYIFVCPTIFLAEKYSERGAKVKFYRFDHRPSTSPWPEWMGATHFEDVQFVFGMPVRYPEEYQDEEKQLSEYIIRTWTNFAKSEDLTLKNGLPWPSYSRSDPEYATLQTGSQMIGSGQRKTQCEFWRPYFDA